MVWGTDRMPVISGKTRVVGIIGNPIGHSLSPVMQNAALAACRLDYVYVPFAVSPDDLGQAVRGLRALGVRGFNVTIPHKKAIIPFLDQLDDSAEAAGAVNTVLLNGATMVGYNTDGVGLVDSLALDLGFQPGAEPIVVIGAGGAARGAIAALCHAGAKKIIICNRSLETARDVMRDMINRYPDAQVDVRRLDQTDEELLGATSLLLNTTSLGMNGERIEGIDLSRLPKHAVVYDMVYSHTGTPLVKEANARGLRAANGIGMLVAQGERAFEIWTGLKPPEGVMRTALAALSTP